MSRPERIHMRDKRIANKCRIRIRCSVNAASSTDRCNTFQCIDSTLLAREDHVFCCTRSRPTQGCVPAGPTVASDLSFCFQCQGCSGLVLRRPIEITAITGQWEFVLPRADRNVPTNKVQCAGDSNSKDREMQCRKPTGI